jgi:hypothetical protein
MSDTKDEYKSVQLFEALIRDKRLAALQSSSRNTISTISKRERRPLQDWSATTA